MVQFKLQPAVLIEMCTVLLFCQKICQRQTSTGSFVTQLQAMPAYLKMANMNMYNSLTAMKEAVSQSDGRWALQESLRCKIDVLVSKGE